MSNADEARRQLRDVTGSNAAKVHATLALAEAITIAARTLANGMIEAARIRRGQA